VSRETWQAPPPSAPLGLEDRLICEQVDTYLSRGLALKRWWQRDGAAGPDSRRFELAFTHNRPDVSFGFFSRTPVDGRTLPILGNFQTQFYDQPKSPSADRDAAARFLNAELREFVLRYFLRVSDFANPQPYTADDPHPPFFLRPFSLCNGREIPRQGFGFSQLYFKRADTGEIGRFPASMRRRIVDLRTLGPVFEWIVARVQIFNFAFQAKPFGDSGPSMTLPLDERSLLVLTSDFVSDETTAASLHAGEIGHYGFGYAFVKDPVPGLLAWGPGRFDAAFQTIDFRVLDDGRIRVDMVFTANRPTGVLAIPASPPLAALEMADIASLGLLAPVTAPLRTLAGLLPLGQVAFDPVFPALALLNAATAGYAARELCISREQVEKDLLLLHFERHYATLAGSLQTWRQIRDWRDEASLPRWVVTGEAA